MTSVFRPDNLKYLIVIYFLIFFDATKYNGIYFVENTCIVFFNFVNEYSNIVRTK